MYNTDLPHRAELPSTDQLLKSTAIAVLVAALILVAVVLPAEYGIDLTGAGRVLGLTAMGEIKQQRAREVTADVAQAPAVAAANPAPVAPMVPAAPVAAVPANARSDEVSFALQPGQAAEYKLTMRKGDKVNFEWLAAGGGVNFDAHGDPVNRPRNFYHGYGKGLNSSGERGDLEAAFDGTHGWYWRNRGKQAVTITLRTRGGYTDIKRVL